MTSQFVVLAERTLRTVAAPMTAAEIVNYAVKNGWFSDALHGKTPAQTMKSKLSVSIRRHGARSPFVRTSPGHFFLSELADQDNIYQAIPVQPPAEREMILAFATASMRDLLPQGIDRDPTRFTKGLTTGGHLIALDRLHAEQSNDHKQLLTYIMVTRGEKILAYKRGVYNRVEDMLRGAQCVGFGGHVRAEDSHLLSPDGVGIIGCANRELREELNLPKVDRSRLDAGLGLYLVGVLNDDSSDVGRRHVAVVLRYETGVDAAWDPPQRGEKSITQLRWIGPADRVNLWEFEYWSQLCLRTFMPDVIDSQPAYRVRRARALQPPRVLCLMGQLGSGKTEAARVLAQDFGYQEVNSGRVLAAILGVPPVPETARSEFQAIAQRFITTETGPAALANALLSEVEALGTDRVLIDGIRQRSTLEALRERSVNRPMGVLYVYTTPDVAHQLYERRGETMTFDQFLELRKAPVEDDVASMLELSDAVLYNWTGRRGYRSSVRTLMRVLGITRRSPS